MVCVQCSVVCSIVTCQTGTSVQSVEQLFFRESWGKSSSGTSYLLCYLSYLLSWYDSLGLEVTGLFTGVIISEEQWRHHRSAQWRLTGRLGHWVTVTDRKYVLTSRESRAETKQLTEQTNMWRVSIRKIFLYFAIAVSFFVITINVHIRHNNGGLLIISSVSISYISMLIVMTFCIKLKISDLKCHSNSQKNMFWLDQIIRSV